MAAWQQRPVHRQEIVREANKNMYVSRTFIKKLFKYLSLISCLFIIMIIMNKILADL